MRAVRAQAVNSLQCRPYIAEERNPPPPPRPDIVVLRIRARLPGRKPVGPGWRMSARGRYEEARG